MLRRQHDQVPTERPPGRPPGGHRAGVLPIRPSARRATAIPSRPAIRPHRLQVADGIEPLLKRGIDGRSETVVFPELAEPQLSRLWSATCARAWRNLTAYSACPPRGYGS